MKLAIAGIGGGLSAILEHEEAAAIDRHVHRIFRGTEVSLQELLDNGMGI
jgi:hypothetical protein